MPDDVARTTLRRVSWRLGALLFFVYVLNYLDRTNISIAKLKMQPDIALSETAFGLGAGLFFVGYFLFEVPSNLILERVGARRWIARVMITWGILPPASPSSPARTASTPCASYSAWRRPASSPASSSA